MRTDILLPFLTDTWRTGRGSKYESHPSAALHTLNPLAAFVWRLSDGQTSPTAMLTAVQATIDPQATATAIDLATATLANAGLLEGDSRAPFSQNRRTLLKRAAVGGALMPVVVSVTVPMAAHAASPLVCSNGQFATLQECEAGIPEHEEELRGNGCRIETPFQCYLSTETDCYWIFGSVSGC